jgi:hypothetical protein
MRSSLSPRWLVVALFGAGLLAVGQRSAHAAPLRQDFQISVVAFVDVSPATDPNCPGCNGEFDAEDADYAAANAFGTMDFLVRDDGGNVIAQQTTSELSVGIQRTLFTVPEGPQFTVELVAPPDGWQLCPNESATRTLTEDDFQLGNAREEYHFTQGCNVQQETPTPEPGTPTNTPEPGVPTNTPAARPTDDDDDDDDEASEGDKTDPALGYIKGFACIDLNANGVVDPNDPGLNDVRVYLAGGSTQLNLITPGSGSYSFDGLGPGTYDLWVTPGPEWRITTKQKYTVNLSPGQVLMGIDFCMIRHGAAAPAAPVKVIAGRGVRLPATGFADLPPASILGGLTLLLGALGALGMSAERRKNGRS